MEARKKDFWDKESRANNVRRQDISNLNYISIPDNLPLINSGFSKVDEIAADNLTIVKCCESINQLKGLKILNLTGISNTDLKLSYGVANLDSLSEYDENFTKLVKNIASLGHELLVTGDTDDATAILEYGISINTDIRSNYMDLAKIYSDMGQTEKINLLKDKASKLQSLNGPVIVSHLEDYEQ